MELQDLPLHAVMHATSHVGDDAVLGAASVVTKDVPAGSIVVGWPARVVRSVPD